MAVQTSKVTTAGNGILQLDPGGTGKVQLTKLAGGGNQPVGVDNTGNTARFLPSTSGARGTALGTDIVMVQAAGATAVTQTTITALVAAGGGGGGGLDLTALSVSTVSPPTRSGALTYNNTTGVFSFTPVNSPGSYLGATPPSPPTSGDLWYDTTSGELFVWNGSAWVQATPCCTTTFSAGTRSLSSDRLFEVVTVTIGQVLTLNAELTDIPDDFQSITYEWYKGNQLIDNQTTNVIETQSVNANHLGLYTCRMLLTTTSDTHRISKSFFVTESTTAFTSADAIGAAGPIYSIEFDGENGTGYTNVGPVTVPTEQGGDGNLTLEITSDGDSVQTVSVVNAGAGYESPSVVKIMDGNEDAYAVVTFDVTFSVTTAGTGYSAGQYPVSGGSGTGLELDVTVGGSGEILTATMIVDFFNNDYQQGDVLTLVGGNNDAVIEIATINEQATLFEGGTGYIATGPVTVNATGGSGSNATVEVTSNGDNILSVTLVNAGTGYLNGETLTIAGGDDNALITIKV